MDKTTIQLNASENITQGAPVKIAAGEAAMLDADTENMIGIATRSALEDEQVPVAIAGVHECIVDGNAAAIAVGDELMGGVSKLVKYSSDTGHVRVGRALAPATADGQIIHVLIYGSQPVG